MRNIFDQYDQPENKLTHALVATLCHDKKLIRPFLAWLGVKKSPPLKRIKISCQQLPGQAESGIPAGQNSVPDACFYSEDDDWIVIVESKVQAGVSKNQLERHQKKALRQGYTNPFTILLTATRPKFVLPDGVLHREWKSIYQWFIAKSKESEWAGHLTDYMQVYESKMSTQKYNIEGTLTMFSGFQFDTDNPYTYREGKRLVRILGDELKNNKALVKMFKIDPEGKSRPKITQGIYGSVWDFIPSQKNKKGNFTSYPHLSIGLWPHEAWVCVTIPNGIKGGIKSRLKGCEGDDFANLLLETEKKLTGVLNKYKVPNAKLFVYIHQKHYQSQNSPAQTHGRLDVDLRTLVDKKGKGFRYQPGWADAIVGILTQKRTNIQFGTEARLPYTAKCMQSSKALDVMAELWVAQKQFFDFFELKSTSK